jgi:hypothetical protein
MVTMHHIGIARIHAHRLRPRRQKALRQSLTTHPQPAAAPHARFPTVFPRPTAARRSLPVIWLARAAGVHALEAALGIWQRISSLPPSQTKYIIRDADLGFFRVLTSWERAIQMQRLVKAGLVTANRATSGFGWRITVHGLE